MDIFDPSISFWPSIPSLLSDDFCNFSLFSTSIASHWKSHSNRLFQFLITHCNQMDNSLGKKPTYMYASFPVNLFGQGNYSGIIKKLNAHYSLAWEAGKSVEKRFFRQYLWLRYRYSSHLPSARESSQSQYITINQAKEDELYSAQLKYFLIAILLSVWQNEKI